MRRNMMIVAIVMIVTMVLSACGTTPTQAPAEPTKSGEAGATTAPVATTAPAEAAATTAPAAASGEKVLRFITGQFDMDWSPLRGGGWPGRYLSLWWAPPVWVDMKGTIHASVFNEWSSNADFTVWTFKIDPKAVFSDGSAVTAEDIKGGWELMCNPDTRHSRIALFLAGVKGYDAASKGEANELPGVTVKDASTVEVTLTSPDPVFVSRIGTNMLPVIKISQARGADGKEIAEWWSPKNNVAVSGPFMPAKMDLDKGELEFVRNPNWFGQKPILDKITFVTIEDPQTATLMLKNGEADVDLQVNLPSTFDDLGGDFLGVSLPATPVVHYFWINSFVAPVDDINCRKALILSVNVPEMFKTSLPHGPGAAGTTLLSAIVGDKDAEPFAYDPEAAKAAFAQCKYKDAMPKIIIAGASNPQSQAAGEYILEQWRQILGITEVELNAKFDELAKADQGKVQFFRDDAGTRFPDPVSVLQATVYSKSGNAQTKLGGYKNPEVDKLIEEAATKKPEDPARADLAIQADKLVMQDYVFIPFYNEGPLMMAMPYVKGYVKNLDWQIMEPWNLDIAK